MARAVKDRLRDIEIATKDIQTYVTGIERPDFPAFLDGDRLTFRAIKQAFSEIGESIKDLPKEVTDRWPGIDWRGLAGLRDIVSHAYFNVDPDRLFMVILEDLPGLDRAVGSELRRLAAKPIIDAATAKALSLPKSPDDLLDDLAASGTEEHLTRASAEAASMTDLAHFLAEHGIVLPEYDT